MSNTRVRSERIVTAFVLLFLAGVVALCLIAARVRGSYSPLLVGVAVIWGGLALATLLTKRDNPPGCSSISWLGIIFCCWVLITFVVIPYRTISLFQQRIDTYISSSGARQGETAYVRGKVLPIDMKEKTVDVEVFWALPDDLRPSKLEDVQTVVRLNWSSAQVGRYEHGGAAYAQYCKVTVVDRTLPAMVGSVKEFVEYPPDKSPEGRTQTGGIAMADIVGYLSSLPRK